MQAKRVLLLERNPDQRLILKTLLEYYGYTVVEGEWCEAMAEAVRACAPDLVLLDICPPSDHGMATARTLQADRTTATIPVVGMLDHEEGGAAARLRELGFSGLIVHPMNSDKVIARIRAAMAGTQAPRPPGSVTAWGQAG
jgi:DNA-binding response OmpR family regulator